MSALFIKPLFLQSESLFSAVAQQPPGMVSFRSLDLDRDLPGIHSWTTQPYTAQFWQLNVAPDKLRTVYESMLDNPLAHSFIAAFNGKMVGQIDCYHVSAEEIGEHISGDTTGHCGIHILMQPPRESIKGLTELVLRSFVQYYFSFPEAEALYGEPDAANPWGNNAAKKAGFEFQKTIQLSYKTANLYSITREQFFQSLSNDNAIK